MKTQPAAPQREGDRRDPDRDRPVEREPPGEGDEPVGARREHEEDDAADASEREARRRRDVAVASGEGTRGERGEELREGRRDQPRQRVGRDGRGLVRQLPVISSPKKPENNATTRVAGIETARNAIT